jgi:hypothetical protein
LGLDAYKRTIPGISASHISVTLPDGTTIRQKALQAAAELEEIFDRRGIPHVSQ